MLHLLLMFLPILQGPKLPDSHVSLHGARPSSLSHPASSFLIQSHWTLEISSYAFQCWTFRGLPISTIHRLKLFILWGVFSDLSGHSWHYKHGSRASAQIPLSRALCHGFKLCGHHALLIMLAVLLWIKSSSVEKAVSGTWRLTSSPVLPPWFSSACPASPFLSQPNNHLPFPPIPTKELGCKCWRSRLRLGAFEDLHTGYHHAQRSMTQKSK